MVIGNHVENVQNTITRRLRRQLTFTAQKFISRLRFLISELDYFRQSAVQWLHRKTLTLFSVIALEAEQSKIE